MLEHIHTRFSRNLRLLKREKFVSPPGNNCCFPVATDPISRHIFAMKPLLPVALLLLALSPLQAREFRDLTNNEGKTIKAELLDLTPEGMVKVNVALKPYEIPLSSLSEADQTWLKKWDAEKKLGKDAAYYDRLIFEDDFSSNAFGPRWGHYKSASVVKDGILIGITPDPTDHAAVDNIVFEGEKDLEVSVKFKFVSGEAKRFDIWFDDKNYKGAHAGHICQVSISPDAVQIMDAKEGRFKSEYYTVLKAGGTLDPETQKLINSKVTRSPIKFTLNEWHTLLVRTKGDEVTVALNGENIGSFKSNGIAHDTKSLVSLTTNNVDIHYDDFSIKAGGEAPKKK